jgi:hypothetical protein
VVVVGQTLEVKIKIVDIGIRIIIIMDGKIKVLIHHKNAHGKIIIYLHQITTIIINGVEIIIIIIIMDNQIMINGNLLINLKLHNKINQYLILKQIQLLFMLKQVVNIIFNIINIQLHYNKQCLHSKQVHQ